MGWKAVKDHYRIGHIVHVSDDRILIGSPFVRDLLAVAPDGVVVPSSIVRDDRGELGRYRAEMEADPAALRELIARPDSFERSVTVWTWRGAEIVEDACEETGWPNVTHSGALMYDNTFSTDRDQAVAWAAASLLGTIPRQRESIAEAEADLGRKRDRLATAEANLCLLEARHPTIVDRMRADRAAEDTDDIRSSAA